MKNKRIKWKKGFTLMEMMLVVVIMGILLAIGIPIYSSAIESGNVREFEANHNMIVAAVNMYTATHNGAYPTAANQLDPYLYNDNGASTSLASINRPTGATYQVTFGNSKTRPSIVSKYKTKTITYNTTAP